MPANRMPLKTRVVTKTARVFQRCGLENSTAKPTENALPVVRNCNEAPGLIAHGRANQARQGHKVLLEHVAAGACFLRSCAWSPHRHSRSPSQRVPKGRTGRSGARLPVDPCAAYECPSTQCRVAARRMPPARLPHRSIPKRRWRFPEPRAARAPHSRVVIHDEYFHPVSCDCRKMPENPAG